MYKVLLYRYCVLGIREEYKEWPAYFRKIEENENVYHPWCKMTMPEFNAYIRAKKLEWEVKEIKGDPPPVINLSLGLSDKFLKNKPKNIKNAV